MAPHSNASAGLTWILVAERALAKIYQHQEDEADLSIIQEFNHPQGRLKNQDLDADRPSHNRTGFKGTKSVYSREQDAKAHVTEVFVKQLAEFLDKSCSQNRYGHLVLVAEPHFLGLLRQNLKDAVRARIRSTINKDLIHLHPRELKERLAEMNSL